MKTKRFYQNKALIYGVCALSLIGAFDINNAFAASNVTYQRTVNPEFVINESISVSLSSADLVINDLTPGQSADSNIITVTVSSNSPSGYKLGSTVGNEEEYKTDTLVHTSGASTGTFTNMTTAGALTAGEWGYSYSADAGTTWSTYDGLPLYSNDGAAELINTGSEGSTSVQFKIGAYATAQQVAGEYKNVVNFAAVSNPEPKTIANSTYMQEVNSCPNTLETGKVYTLTDDRDNETYAVAKLADGKCWMLDNLRLDVTNFTVRNNLTSSNTNVDATSLTSFRDGNRSAGANYANAAFSPTWSDTYSAARASAEYKNTAVTNYGFGSGKTGVYYNFCAASAGSYCYDDNNPPNDPNASTLQDAKYDLCPAGWHMPTGGAFGEYQNLLTAYSNVVAVNIDSFQYNLSTPLSGYFVRSAYQQYSNGYFWSSTYYNGRVMHYLNLTASRVYLTDYYFYRDGGLPMRCVSPKI